MKKSHTLIIATTLISLMAGVQLTTALAVDAEKPTVEMKKSFSPAAFETKDTSKEGLCLGIGDFKNKNCPQLVQSKSKKDLEKSEKQEEQIQEQTQGEVKEEKEEKSVYVLATSEKKSKKEEKKEEKTEEEIKNKEKVLGASTVRPAAPIQPTNDSSQQIMLLTILIILTFALTLITELRTQKIIQQIQTQLGQRRKGGKLSKK